MFTSMALGIARYEVRTKQERSPHKWEQVQGTTPKNEIYKKAKWANVLNDTGRERSLTREHIPRSNRLYGRLCRGLFVNIWLGFNFSAGTIIQINNATRLIYPEKFSDQKIVEHCPPHTASNRQKGACHSQ